MRSSETFHNVEGQNARWSSRATHPKHALYAHLKWSHQAASVCRLTGVNARFNLAGRECEFLALTPDTSEVDLKMRRELRMSEQDSSRTLSVIWFDQAVVRAALNGRVLILEGLEKAERNVLPLLNNLLENREMQLEDGRFLVAPKRYDNLVAGRSRLQHLQQLKLVRVHEDFRVVALGVPAPPFPGNPLDPPLRSRFQARFIDRVPLDALLFQLQTHYAPHASAECVEELLSFHEGLWALMKLQAQTSGTEARNLAFGSPCFPCEESLISAAQLLELAPGLSVHQAVSAIFPFGKASGLLRAEAAQLVSSILPHPQSQSEAPGASASPVLEEVLEEGTEACFKIRIGRDVRTFRCRRGPDKVQQRVALDLPDHQRQILTGMLLSASVGRDICLIGPRGEGKTFLARQFGHALGYSHLETLFLHEEMTSRDLFQRRATNRQGESTWEPSPLLQAMQNGGLCVLDGLQQLRPGSLASLIQVIQDREVALYDGTRFVSPWRWKVLVSLGLTSEQLSSRGLRWTHPTFRLVALATPNDAHRRSWLTNEVLQLFHFFTLPVQPELGPVIAAAVPDCPQRVLRSLLRVRQLLYEASQDSSSSLWTGTKDGANPSVMLSLRAILRAARTAAAAPSSIDIASEIGAYLQSALMTDFMPAAESGAVLAVLRTAGFRVHSKQARLQNAAGMAVQAADLMDSEPTLRIGNAVCRVQAPLEKALVPETQFFHNPQQTLALHDMLRDIAASEHLLLMGNQGVGKNKLIDKMLMLLHREREYIQLHRDTTVGSLTLVPSLRNGLLCYDDSPLVKAMINGRVLVIDEFDKAPTEVVLTLKGLLQDGEILLADGRRFVRHRNIHEAFLVVALANRPGFPFLGNDFFREMGDCFACHAVQNPDQVSEVAMLQSYAPQVPVALLEMLSASFSELRQMVEDGKLSYPYSTRELVNIVRHLAVYPDDSIDSVMENVFAFDAFDAQLRQVVFSIFRRHGLPLASDSPGTAAAQRRTRIAAAVHLGPPEKVATFHRSHSNRSAAICVCVCGCFLWACKFSLHCCGRGRFLAQVSRRSERRWSHLCWKAGDGLKAFVKKT